MDSQQRESIKLLLSLSECCICLHAYTDPRQLSCFHTAGLKCFEDLQTRNQKKPGDVLPCPLCRKEFTIPAEGMTGLQKNFFIESLMEVTRAFNVEDESVVCTTCSIMEDASAINNATMRCLDCCENYCTRCSKMHKSQKVTKDHKLVEIKNEFKDEEVRNMFPTRKCKSHSDKDLDYYCSDCKTLVCVSCFVENHKMHECKGVKKLDKDFRQRLEENATKLSDFRGRMLTKKYDIERQKKEYSSKTIQTEQAIKRKSQQLKTLIDKHTQDVLNELSLISEKHQKQIEAEIEEIERKLTVLESFVTYCTELKSKGSPSEVCGNVDKLIAKAKELSNENDEYLKSPRKKVEVSFTPTDESEIIQKGKNVIGHLSDSTKSTVSCAIVICKGDDDPISRHVFRIDLTKSDSVCKIQQTPIKMIHESAAGTYYNSLFIAGVGKNWDEIWRFDATLYTWSRCASMVQGRRRHNVAFIDHVLYICGGYVDSAKITLDNVEAYDILMDKCVAIGKLAHAVQSSGNCVPFKSSIYIFGGNNANGETVNNVQVYDTKLNTCTLLSKPMPRADSLIRAVLWGNGAILIGYCGCLIYNFETEVWEIRDQFKTDVVHFGLTVSNGLVFVIGGGDTDKNKMWICRDDVRCVPVMNILNNEPINWRHHAKLPKPLLVSSFGKLDFVV